MQVCEYLIRIQGCMLIFEEGPIGNWNMQLTPNIASKTTTNRRARAEHQTNMYQIFTKMYQLFTHMSQILIKLYRTLYQILTHPYQV